MKKGDHKKCDPRYDNFPLLHKILADHGIRLWFCWIKFKFYDDLISVVI